MCLGDMNLSKALSSLKTEGGLYSVLTVDLSRGPTGSRAGPFPEA